MRIAEILGKINALWRRGGNGAEMGNPSSRLGFEMGPRENGDAMSMISPDFEENNGHPMSLRSIPFLLANRGCGLPKFWVKLRASGGGAGMMPKWVILLRD